MFRTVGMLLEVVMMSVFQKNELWKGLESRKERFGVKGGVIVNITFFFFFFCKRGKRGKGSDMAGGSRAETDYITHIGPMAGICLTISRFNLGAL